MITTDFAPNESWDDAWLSLKLIFQPWRWKKGKESEEVKEKIKNLLNVTSYKLHVACFLSGRSALYLLLKSLNLPRSSEVLVQAFTCEAVVLPILANNIKPVYIDIESETYSMDFNSLTRKLVNQKTNLTKVLILQHTFGLTPKYRDQILKLAREKKLIIVEDLAHGLNPSFFKSNPYTLNPNTYFLLSFGRSKMFSSVFGGAILSFNNETMKQLSNLTYPSLMFIFKALLYKPLSMLVKSTYDIFYLGKILHKMLDKFGLLIPEITSKEKKGRYDELFNKAYPNALSGLLLHQLQKFDRTQQQRAKICRVYSRFLKKSNQQLVINNRPLIRFPLLVNNRDEILAYAKERNIFLGTWYDQIVAPKELDLGRVEYKSGSCPKAEETCQKIINLPTNISVNEAERVVNTLADV